MFGGQSNIVFYHRLYLVPNRLFQFGSILSRIVENSFNRGFQEFDSESLRERIRHDLSRLILFPIRLRSVVGGAKLEVYGYDA